MKMIRTLIIICCFAMHLSCAADGMETELVQAAIKHLSQSFTEEDIRNSVKQGLWNAGRSAVVIALPGTKKTTIVMFIQGNGKSFKPVDISLVEDGSLGKIGIGGRKSCSKVESVPVEWIARDDECFQIKIRTRAWKDGQRYTVYEPLIVTADGRALYR
jgi:hypothetical protein